MFYLTVDTMEKCGIRCFHNVCKKDGVIVELTSLSNVIVCTLYIWGHSSTANVVYADGKMILP